MATRSFKTIDDVVEEYVRPTLGGRAELYYDLLSMAYEITYYPTVLDDYYVVLDRSERFLKDVYDSSSEFFDANMFWDVAEDNRKTYLGRYDSDPLLRLLHDVTDNSIKSPRLDCVGDKWEWSRHYERWVVTKVDRDRQTNREKRFDPAYPGATFALGLNTAKELDNWCGPLRFAGDDV